MNRISRLARVAAAAAVCAALAWGAWAAEVPSYRLAMRGTAVTVKTLVNGVEVDSLTAGGPSSFSLGKDVGDLVREGANEIKFVLDYSGKNPAGDRPYFSAVLTRVPAGSQSQQSETVFAVELSQQEVEFLTRGMQITLKRTFTHDPGA